MWTFFLWEFWAIWEHFPIVLEKNPILHQLLVRHNLVILRERPSFLQQSSGTQTSPVQWTLHPLQSRLFFLSLCASRILLCSWFYPYPMLDLSRACSILYPLRPLRPIFSVLVAHQIVLRHRSKSFACNVVFMVFGLWRFCPLSRGSTRFHFSTEHRFGILLWCTVRLSCHISFALILRGQISDASNFSKSSISMSSTRISLFQIPPAISVFLPNWWTLVWSLVGIGWDSISAPNGIMVFWMILQIVFHTVFSHLPENLGCFADNNSIPKNRTTTFHPVLIVAILLKCLLFSLRTALSAMPVVSDRWEVLKCGDSMIKPHMPSQIPSSCLYAQLSICAIALRLLTNFSPSHVKILFYTDKIESIE